MPSLVIVVIQPELELILNVLKVIVRFNVSPVEFPLHRLVESFDLSVVFWSVRRIHYELDSVGSKTIPEGFGVEPIVRADCLDSSRKLANEFSDEVDGIFNRIPLVYPGNDKPGTIVYCIDGNDIPFLSEWKTGIELNFCSRFIVGIELWIILPSFILSSISNLVSLEDSPDSGGMERYSMILLQFLREWQWSEMGIANSEIIHFLFDPERSSIIRTSFLRSWLLGNEAHFSVPFVLSNQTIEGFLVER